MFNTVGVLRNIIKYIYMLHKLQFNIELFIETKLVIKFVENRKLEEPLHAIKLTFTSIICFSLKVHQKNMYLNAVCKCV